MLFVRFLAFVITLRSIAAAISACASGVTCPPGGIWSGWTTKDSCSSSCGSCAKMYYTRTCLSTSMNCACSGKSSAYVVCNTNACQYPSQKSCCAPYVSMIVNGTLQCGPVPKASSYSPSPITSCCPVGGLWSSWSGFVRNGSTWYQTRRCLSTSAGCPCTGDTKNTTTGCPCPTFKTAVEARVCLSSVYELSYAPNTLSLNEDTCELTGIIKANNLDKDYPCYPFTTWKTFNVGKIRLLGYDNSCSIDYPYDCDDRLEYGANQLTMNISFTCNPYTQQWIYDYTGLGVQGYVSIQQSYRGA